MRPDNGTLAANPDLFVFARSPGKSIAFALTAAVLLAVALLCLLNFEALQEFAEDYSGRRRRLLAPYFPHICIGLAGFFGLWAGIHATRTGSWRSTSGQPLKQQFWLLHGDLDEVHQRLATGDPQIYLPLPVHKQADQARRRLRAYTVPGRPATYLTVTMGVGKNERHWPLITFEGQAHEAFQQVKGRLKKPYKGAPGR